MLLGLSVSSSDQAHQVGRVRCHAPRLTMRLRGSEGLLASTTSPGDTAREAAHGLAVRKTSPCGLNVGHMEKPMLWCACGGRGERVSHARAAWTRRSAARRQPGSTSRLAPCVRSVSALLTLAHPRPVSSASLTAQTADIIRAERGTDPKGGPRSGQGVPVSAELFCTSRRPGRLPQRRAQRAPSAATPSRTSHP